MIEPTIDGMLKYLDTYLSGSSDDPNYLAISEILEEQRELRWRKTSDELPQLRKAYDDDLNELILHRQFVLAAWHRWPFVIAF